jgi:hypothetical protein
MSTASHPASAKSGQFGRLLRSVASAEKNDSGLKGEAIQADKMRPIIHPPDAVLRAYCDLLHRALVFQRNLRVMPDVSVNEASDLADAMHNIGSLLVDYGVCFDDQQYRELYLRPFDRRWAHEGFGLEQFLESRLKRYSGK